MSRKTMKKIASVSSDTVRALAAVQCTPEEIAQVVGTTPKRIRHAYADDIEAGRQQSCASLKRKQFEMAMAGDKTMLIWLGKQYLGQADRTENRHVLGSEAGKPKAVDAMTAEEIQDELARMDERRQSRTLEATATPPAGDEQPPDLCATELARLPDPDAPAGPGIST